MYVKALYSGQYLMSINRVCSFKNVDDIHCEKGWLVAKSFEKKHEQIQKGLPTCLKEALRIVIALVAQNK